MQPFRRILVALAGADSDTALLNYAAMLADLCGGVEIHCAHVSNAPEPAARRQALEEIQRRAEERFSTVLACRQVYYRLLEGDRMDALVDCASAQRVELILLGHGPNAGRRRTLARRLAMKAPCSVWMVPDDAPAALNRVLVPIDFSPQAGDALSLATALAARGGHDDALALHVYFDTAAVGFDEYQEVLIDDEERAFWLFIAPIDLHGIHVKPLFVQAAGVAQAIGRVAAQKGADLIVMGTRGRSRSAAVLLGSETEQVIRETRIPVLAVKHFGAHMRLLEVLRDRRMRDRGGQRFT